MSKARERVLNKAEALFHEQGYNSVSMRDIADALGMRQASLYYHVPDGKEQLFVEVTQRGLERHQRGLTAAITQSAENIEAQLQAAARWVFSQPPMYLFKMMENDMPELSKPNQRILMQLSHEALFVPITTIFEGARNRGETHADVDPARLTGTFLTIIEGIAFANRQALTPMSPIEMADEVIDILLNGLRPRIHS
ncbi:MAG: TetR/AcrR family transcriptional regulator [Anaerolineales bacterium]|nr:TetR/AcrR family transcriptional regulator [Anaerolineales bacterium]